MHVTYLRLAVTLILTTAVPTPFAAIGGNLILAPESRQQPAAAASQQAAPQPTATLEMPATFERHLGDLDGMLKRHQIRALVVPSRSGFFYDRGRPQGIFYEAMEEFQRFANEKLKTGALKISVSYIPVRPDQMESALLEGVGDVIAYGVIVTPEREKLVLFTTPVDADVKQVIVSGPKAPPMNTLEDLSGKVIYANPLTVYFENLQALSASFQQAGKPPILVKPSDPNLTDEDLLEMVNAGLIPATVTINLRADFWSKVFPHLTLHPDMVLRKEGQQALVTRKDSPKLREILNEFVAGRQMGSSFGNTLIRRYLQNTKWVKDSTSSEEMKKFQAYVRYFQKYAAAPPINISDVDTAENNIEAGAKMLRNIAETYFKDDKLDPMNKTLMVFASYDAGPTRIVRLRKKAASEGLDPNQWFGNVELVAAKDIGQETVQYVSNIYKYYVAYKLTLEEANIQK